MYNVVSAHKLKKKKKKRYIKVFFFVVVENEGYIKLIRNLYKNFEVISKPIIFIIKTTALMVLKSYIATFNTFNTKKHVIMVEGKLKNLTVELKR